MEIYKQVASALEDVGAIGKDSRNASQGFNYRGIDDVYNALHPILSKHKLFMTNTILSETTEERKTSRGSIMYSVKLHCRFKMYTTDGSFVETDAVGEGQDMGDKATNKAMSIAYKYALFQLFCIPTMSIDPDGETPEPSVSRGNVRSQKSAAPAKQNPYEGAVGAIDGAKDGATMAKIVDAVIKRVDEKVFNEDQLIELLQKAAGKAKPWQRDQKMAIVAAMDKAVFGRLLSKEVMKAIESEMGL